MTSPVHAPAPYPPAWYRRLPRPPTEHNPALRRTSLLSQHHLFRGRSPVLPVEEDVPRRNTVHLPESSNHSSALADHVERQEPAANGVLEAAPPSQRGHSLDMAEEPAKKVDLATSSQPREHLCLCPPDPKIPRPRNSFILFRQHQQASILAQNPGIPNPEVSKIIGEQWRHLAAESKEEWNLRAEEEKARHQQQYPGYRYQPRRNGRLSNQSSVSGPSTAEPQEPCPKCGGKPMNYYSNPTPVYTPPASQPPQQQQQQQTMGVQVPAKRGYVVSAAPGQRMHGQPTVSPEHVAQQKVFIETYPFQRVDPRLIYAVPPGQALPTPPSSDSQDAKRRRFNISGGYVATREHYPDAPYSYAHSPVATSVYGRPEMLQQIHASQHPVHGLQIAKPAMVSPPRAVYPHPPQLKPIRPPQLHQRTRSNVALPPIETVVPQTPTASGSLSVVQSQSSGVEAMIMSIPVLNKIKVLAQISPPLLPPGPTSPKPEVRGAIIALEGMDERTVDSMTSSLADQLEKEGKFAVRIFGGPDPYPVIQNARNGNSRRPLTTETYLSMLSQWHKINKEMVEFITTKPGSTALAGSRISPVSLSGPGDDLRTMDGTTASTPPKGSEHVMNVNHTYEPLISPKTITKAAELSIASPPPAKSRSQSTPGFSMNGFATDSAAGDVQLTSSTGTTRPLPLSFPRPLNSRRVPPPPPTPPPTTSQQLPHPAATSSWQMPPPSMLHAVSCASEPSGLDHHNQERGQQLQQEQQSSSSSSSSTNRGTQGQQHQSTNQGTQDQQQQQRPSTTGVGIDTGPNTAAVPIALIPHYQLTTVDASSISLPISDGFSPPAHWQWFATLWRGSVGPDLTVVIKGLEEEHEPSAVTENGVRGPAAPAGTAHSGGPLSTPGGGPAARDRTSSASLSSTSTASHSGVEIRLHDCRAVIVKTGIIGSTATAAEAGGSGAAGKTAGAAAYHAKEMDNWEKAKRRVGFEVDEFLRR